MAIIIGPQGKILVGPNGDIATNTNCCCGSGGCPNNEPSILLTVTGSTGTVNWCGETWNLPADSGVSKEVCPTTYINQKLTNSGSSIKSIYARNSWKWITGSSTQLGLRRMINKVIALPGQTSIGTQWYNTVAGPISGTVGYGGKDDFHFRRTWSVGSTIFGDAENDTGLGVIDANYPLATVNNYAIGTGMFGSYIGTDGNTYSWQQGSGW